MAIERRGGGARVPADVSEADVSEGGGPEAAGSKAGASEANGSKADASEARSPEAGVSKAGATEADASEAGASEAGGGHPAEEADPHCLTDAEIDLLLRDAPWRRYAVVGDSLAEGLGDPAAGYRSSPWADRLADTLRRAVPDLAYLNLGERGLTAAQVRAGQADRAAEFGPDLIGVVCGGNDLLLPGFSPAVLERELDLLFARVATPGTTVFAYALANVAAAVPELRGGPLERGIAVLNGVMREVAGRYGAVLVEMYDHPAVAERGLYSADLVHASARGHAVIASATLRALAARISA